MTKFLQLVICVFIFTLFVAAAEPVIWSTNSRADFLRGEARGVSILETGAIVVAPQLTEVFNTEQAYVWSSAADEKGNVFLGTGSDGKIFRTSADGKSLLFSDLSELNVSALAIGKDGLLYAGTSPDGKVYRIAPDGKADVFFEPKEKYIWSLAVMNDGSLAVGTGENGKIFRVKTANSKPADALLFDSSETHIICLAVDKQNNLIAGTDQNGLVLRVAPDGKAFGLLDAPLREIHDVKVAPDGSIYALALAETASASTIPATTQPMQTGGTPAASVSVSIVATEAPAEQARSKNNLENTKSAVFRILPDGGTDILWSSTTVTAFSILPHSFSSTNGILIGTADKGRIYAVTDAGRETLLLQTNEGQISTLITGKTDIFATSSNQGKLYKFNEAGSEGYYESPVRDARNSALWGRIWWNSRGSIELQTRTGNTEKPDATWSDWSAAYREAKGAQITSPKARFLQWKAVLRNSAGGAANLGAVNVSYLARNIAPEILSIAVLPTNLGLQSNIQPPVDPNIESSGLDPTLFGLPPAMSIPPRRLYQRGAVSLTWTAEDRNGDKLEYALYYRSLNEQNFRLLKVNLHENFFTIDAATLSDGHYIFKVVASDLPANSAGQALNGEKVSEPVEIDNSAPIVTAVGTPQISGDKARMIFEVTDGSWVKRAEYSLNSGEWQSILAADGISDSPQERYTVEISIPVGESTVSFRAFDANGNIGNARVAVRR